MDNEVSVSDLINSAIDEKPLDFKQAISDMLASRAAQAVQQYKLDIAGNTFGEPAAEEDTVEDQDNEFEDEEELEDNEEE